MSIKINYNTLPYRAVFILTSLLFSSLPGFTSEGKDEFYSSTLQRGNLAHISQSFEDHSSTEEGFYTLPPECITDIFFFLPLKDQVSMREISIRMKEIIDMQVWPQQTRKVKGERLSVVIGTIKNLPFRSLSLSFKLWEIEDLGSLSFLTRLTELKVDSNEIGPAGAKPLANLTNLVSLSLWNSRIGNPGVEEFIPLTNLTTLILAGNKVGPAGTKPIAKLTNLTSLNLWNNRILSVGLEELTVLTNLKSLTVGINHIGNAGMKPLARITSLTFLDISDNGISEVGELSPLTNLTSLEADMNRISDKDIEVLANSLSKLTNLCVGENHIRESGVKAFEKLTSLTYLRIGENPLTSTAEQKLKEFSARGIIVRY
ncbi:F-box protein [Candidatus Odyssella acanthamoebae]|uniref:F-box protein n=1 Tax=Candidatus Odyssella acanthamoebae TaxID=91604 RepID=UPI001E44438D|nr:F-box protein [Candidatus Paracaedibacter acanthamoebae]